MSTINIKMLTEANLSHLKRNIDRITTLIKENETNEWVYREFSEPVFSTKTITIEDFTLNENKESLDKEIDLKNSIKLYEHLNKIPRYILTDEKFWLWLYLEKFYEVSRTIMTIKSATTVNDHWTFSKGKRRGLMFGILSRCYFRVELSIDDLAENKYEITKWVIKNPERFRNLTWRSFSSQPNIVRAVLKGEYNAIKNENIKENNEVYPVIGKFISEIGSVRLLDIISSEDLSKMVYNKMVELLV